MSNMVKSWMCHTSMLIKVVGKDTKNNQSKELDSGERKGKKWHFFFL